MTAYVLGAGGGEQARVGTSTRRSSGSLPPAPTNGTKLEQPSIAVKGEPPTAVAEEDAFAALFALADEAMQVPYNRIDWQSNAFLGGGQLRSAPCVQVAM